MAQATYTTGYYWVRRTKAPIEIGGRSKWILFYDGVYWYAMAKDGILEEYDLQHEGLEILAKVEEYND